VEKVQVDVEEEESSDVKTLDLEAEILKKE